MNMHKYNFEGYYDPTAYEALTNIHWEEKAADKKAAYLLLVYSSTVKTIRGVLRPVFQMAVDDDILLKNPFGFELVGVIVNTEKTRKALTRSQMNNFLKFVHYDNVYYKYYDVFYILFHTGFLWTYD